MTTNTHSTDPVLQYYLNSIGQSEHPVLAVLRERIQSRRLGRMAIARKQATMSMWLAKLLNAERYLEVGVSTGYSSTAIAPTLPEDGRITAYDVNATFTDIVRETWQAAGIAHKISFHLQSALPTLDDLMTQGESESYDLALIDADKPPTPKYSERCLQLVRSGDVIAIDNILLGGHVMNEAAENDPPSLNTLRHFNQNLSHDTRIILIILPIGDGLTLLLKE